MTTALIVERIHFHAMDIDFNWLNKSASNLEKRSRIEIIVLLDIDVYCIQYGLSRIFKEKEGIFNH